MKLAAAVVLLVVILLAQEKENRSMRHGFGGDGTVHEGEGWRKARRRLRRERGPTDFGFTRRL